MWRSFLKCLLIILLKKKNRIEMRREKIISVWYLKIRKTNFRIIGFSFKRCKQIGIKHNKMYYEQIFFWHLKENVQIIQIIRAFLISKDKKEMSTFRQILKHFFEFQEWKMHALIIQLPSPTSPQKSRKKTTRPANSWIPKKEQRPP